MGRRSAAGRRGTGPGSNHIQTRMCYDNRENLDPVSNLMPDVETNMRKTCQAWIGRKNAVFKINFNCKDFK